ncbi:hypothetical protein RQM65_03790 [Pricia sp. S334]|uniref:Uncharacterized protein n=1 Tax=Pricia mediterranea TaxID=3076079 RepID=A0ABU3L220_9FLAO|nr:hypothetical protein [Pricia sp. S334]MDT7827786.1 hypothetical protein [Pricia sp. S334]
MKFHNILLITLALTCNGLGFAQYQEPNNGMTPISQIVIDLNDAEGIDPGEVQKYNALKKGQFFRLKIDNVNTYLYDVSVGNEDIDTSMELPASVLDLVDFGGVKASLQNLNTVSGTIKKFVALGPETGLLGSDTDKVLTVEELRRYLAGVKSRAKSDFTALGTKTSEVENLFLQGEDFRNTMTTVERNLLGEVPSKGDIKALLVSFKERRADIFRIKEKLLRDNAGFMKVVELNKALVSENKVLKASIGEIGKVYTALIKAVDYLIEQLSAENYGKFSAVLIGVLNNLDFSYTSMPIQHHSDVNELVIQLKPRDKYAKLSRYSTVLRIPDIEKSFWAVSTGFYLTGNPENSYSIVERVDNGQSLYDFLKEDKAEIELGINTMIRHGRRIGEVLETPTFWHFGFGAGLSIDQKFKPRLMAGTGLAFGGKNKLIIDFGAVHVYYDTLSKAYTLKANTVLPKDFLVNATKIQGYVSVGYLIGL